jgi:hypothetical protein
MDSDPKLFGNRVALNCKYCKGEVKLYHPNTGEYKEMCHGSSSKGDHSLLIPVRKFIEEDEFSFS